MRVLRILVVTFAVALAGLFGSGVATAAPATPAVVKAAAAPAAVPAAVKATAGLVPGTPCKVTARACVDLSARRAWLISNGRVSYGPVAITSGMKGYRTPVGTFRVSFKDVDHVSSVFDSAPMPNSVFFNGGIAFHQGSLKQLSHGCIHLSRKASQKFFATLQPGSVVQVAA